MSPGADRGVRLGIVSYRTPELLDRCLSSLGAAAPGMDLQVVVVDNNSGDESLSVARSHPGVTVFGNEANVGYARAMNLALSDTRASVLVALNPDAILPEGALTELVDVLLSRPEVGLVAPQLRNPDGSVQHSVHRFPSVSSALVTGLVPPRLRSGRIADHFWLEGSADTDRAGYVDWAVGAVHVIRRSALGGGPVYSERSFMYAEDLEVCWRLHRLGWRVWYEPTVAAEHVGNAAGSAAFAGSREERWLDATYDWYVSDRGATRARAWAAANTVGLSAKLAVISAQRERDHAREVRQLLTLHSRRVIDPVGDQHSRLPLVALATEDSGPRDSVREPVLPSDQLIVMPKRVDLFADELGSRFSAWVPRFAITNALPEAAVGDLTAAVAGVVVLQTEDLESARSLIEGAGVGVDFVGRVGAGDRRALVVTRGDPAPFPQPPSGFRVLAVIPAFNEADVIAWTVQYLIAEGVHVHVLDNWSSDGTSARLAHLLESGMVTIEQFPQGGPTGRYAWLDLLGRVAQVGAESGADWCILHDADERRRSPWHEVGLRDALYEVQRRGFSAINHTIAEFHPVDDSFEPGQDVEELLQYWAPAHIGANRTQVKAWHAPGRVVDLISTGGHEALFSGSRIFPYHFLLKHYPIRSQKHGEQKVLRDRKPRWDPQERARRWHRHYDHVRAGHNFLKDPDSLYRFDTSFETDLLIERLLGTGDLGEPPPPSRSRALIVAALESLHLRQVAVRVRELHRMARRLDLETGKR